MSFSLLHKVVAYLLAGLGLLALSFGEELTLTLKLLIGLAYAGSYFAEGKLLERKAYSAAWTGAVVLGLVVQLLRAFTEGPTLAMAIEFAALLQISRLFNRRTAADYQQVAVLAFIHLIAATVLSSSLDYALVFVGFVVATPWMLALSHLRREIEGNYPAAGDGDPQARTAIRRVLASKRVVGPRFLLGTALLSVPLFAMTLAIFVMVPRVGQGFLSFQRSEGQRVTGFGNQVELGGFGVIRDDPTVVLRVTPLPEKKAAKPRLSLRLRGTSFDHYDGRRWTRSPSVARSVMRVSRSHYPVQRRPDLARDRQLRIVLDHLDEPVIFLPSGTVALSIQPRSVHGGTVPRRLFRSMGLDIRYEDSDELGLVYTAFVSRDRADRDLPELDVKRRSHYLQLPQGHDWIESLARRVAGAGGTPLAKAQRIQSYLHSEAFRYTLEQPKVGQDQQPLKVFLESARRGHCEYFSSAMAIMLRSQGVPTRNVTGFVGGRYNPYGGYYALRQGDAHSWVEAHIEGRGWVTFDPTPPARAAAGPRENLWTDLNALVDALRTRWMTSVVGYDLRTQVSLLRKLAMLFASQSGAGRAARDHDAAELSLADKKGYVLAALALVALLGLAWFGRRYLRGRDERAQALPPHVAEAVRLYHDLERAMQARGVARRPADTPLEHVQELQHGGFAQLSEVQEVTRRYMAVRYGEEPLPASELKRLRAAVERVRQDARM